MISEQMNIQWFPGHMTKARRMITANIKLVDAVCEIIDARIPLSSRNPDLDDMTAGKPRLIVLNRTDQADPESTDKWAAHLKKSGAAVLETDCKSGKGINGFTSAVRSLLSEKLERNKQKGQAGRQLRIMVVGIPNVGKSSFINRLAKRRAAQTSDRPGVTKGKQWISLENGFELLDTPGVLWPKFEDQTVAENLAFTGAIRDAVMDIETLGANLMARLCRFYPKRIAERYKIDIPTEASGYELLTLAAGKRGFLLKGGVYDTERMAIILLDEFRGDLLGRITLESVGD
ncbi:MAG: ribosome biogenesis GTPase YlqF [Oscillospiraceae bacterium]|nr:ribosome biogenesis GTPase YlqF [Oscillospiraceae bacterium]